MNYVTDIVMHNERGVTIIRARNTEDPPLLSHKNVRRPCWDTWRKCEMIPVIPGMTRATIRGKIMKLSKCNVSCRHLSFNCAQTLCKSTFQSKIHRWLTRKILFPSRPGNNEKDTAGSRREKEGWGRSRSEKRNRNKRGIKRKKR